MDEKRKDPPPSALSIEPGGEVGPHTRSGGVPRPQLSVDQYVDGVLGGDRAVLGRALTLVESSRPDHQELAQEVLTRLLPHAGRALRVGITGVPGAGKSTFIEALGTRLTAEGRRLAVLAVDPSSGVSGGSILGDKTRMTELGRDPRAFVRPSPSAGTLGGVARKTRESMVVVEAAGHDVVLVETIGVGQSETVVAEMTDVFFALLLAGAGDELQGIKRGLLDLVDVVALNKADGPDVLRVERAATQLRSALHLLRGGADVPVLPCSATTGRGLDEVWAAIAALHARRSEAGALVERRRQQSVRWMRALIDERLLARLRSDPRLLALLEESERDVREDRLPAVRAAERVVRAVFEGGTGRE